jgi:hypothetical protein
MFLLSKSGYLIKRMDPAGMKTNVIAGLNAYNLGIFYSPIIIVIIVIGYSLVFQGYKGLIYLAIVLLMTVVRMFVYNRYVADPLGNSVCDQLQFGSYGNSSLSAFIFGFTIIYLILPMINNDDLNVLFLVGWVSYLMFDFFTRMMYKCLKSTDYLINLFLGSLIGAAWVYIMYQIQSGKYLFFNEFSANKETCSMPSKQQFKCFVMQNGQEISEVPS